MEQVVSKRVFLNNVDLYSSQLIAKFLSTCVSGDCESTDESDNSDAGADAGADADKDGQTPKGGTFQIVGTVSSSNQEKSNFLLDVYQAPSRDDLLGRLLECDVVVYNVSENATKEHVDEATWAITELHRQMESFSSQKMFIMVSTVMTWALTQPQEDLDSPLTDEHYRRRRPHPNFKDISNLENLVLKLGREKKSNLAGYVVASGLQYGEGENIFHYFFKASWSMALEKVPVFGPGSNYVPMIHINDLAGVIHNIIDLRPTARYILAVDDSRNTLEDIVKRISSALGPGRITKLPEEEAVLMKAFKPEQMDYLSVDLRLEAVHLRDTFSLRWTSERGMVENMDRVVEEYRSARRLHPIRIFVTGPPAAGKTTVAQKLCEHYQLHPVHLRDVVKEKITQLEEIVKGGDEDPDEDMQAAAKDQLEEIQESMSKNGRLSDRLTFQILQDKLNSPPCQNQGFVLDGYPETYEQAKVIFRDESENEVKSKTPVYNQSITPDHVFVLDVSDQVLAERARGLPQSVAEESGYTCREFAARLSAYRDAGGAEDTLWDYFDELEIHPEHIDATADDPERSDAVKKITEAVGPPSNYGPGAEELEAESQRARRAERRRPSVREAAEKRRRDEAALEELLVQREEWNRNLSEVERQQYQLSEARSLPLRNYLMKYVMPSLTQAMLDCCSAKPEDPVDYLAEHLLRNNADD